MIAQILRLKPGEPFLHKEEYSESITLNPRTTIQDGKPETFRNDVKAEGIGRGAGEWYSIYGGGEGHSYYFVEYVRNNCIFEGRGEDGDGKGDGRFLEENFLREKHLSHFCTHGFGR